MLWPAMLGLAKKLRMLALVGFCSLSGCTTGRSGVTVVSQPERYVLIRPTGSGRQLELPPDILAQHEGSLLEPVYELCLDFPTVSQSSESPNRSSAPAAMTTVRATPGLPGADVAIEGGLRAWKWSVFSSRPLTQLGRGPFCWRQRLRFAVPAASEIVSGPAFAHRMIKGAEPHLPLNVRLAHAGEALDASYRVCLDREHGQIQNIETEVGIPGADTDIIEQLRTWAWHVELPPEHSGPICWTQDFQFVIPGERDDELIWLAGTVAAPPYKLAFLPAILSVDTKAPARSLQAPSSGPPITIKKQLLYGPSPHLPDSLKARYLDDLVIGTYKICIGPDGAVRSVEPILPIFGATKAIVNTLSSWRFAPLPVPICYLQFLEFHVDRGS